MKFLKLVTILIALILITSCEDDNPTDGGGDSSGLSVAVSGSVGSTIKFTNKDGLGKSASGNSIFWASGQLLNSNYFKQMRINSDVGTLRMQFNINKDVKFHDMVSGNHTIYQKYLRLEETSYIDNYLLELHFSYVKEGFSDEFEEFIPLSGEVTFYKNRTFLDIPYIYSGEINADYKGRSFKVYFWSETSEW